MPSIHVAARLQTAVRDHSTGNLLIS